MSDLDDLILRDYDDIQCYACHDGRTLADGWKCGVCGRLNSKDEDYIMNEQQNTDFEHWHEKHKELSETWMNSYYIPARTIQKPKRKRKINKPKHTKSTPQ